MVGLKIGAWVILGGHGIRPAALATAPSPIDLERALQAGVDRVLLMLPNPDKGEVMRLLDEHSERRVRQLAS